MTKNTITITAEALKSNANIITVELIDTVNAQAEEKVKAFDTAAAAYLEDLKEKQAAIDGKAADVEQQLAEINERKQKLVQEMTAAIASGDDAKAAAAEKEADKLSAEAHSLSQKLDLMRQVKAKGNDALYDEAADAFDAQLEALAERDRTLFMIADAAREHINRLESIEGKIQGLVRVRSLRHGKTKQDVKMVEIAELHDGVIDVTGHHAGTDEEAKLRYVKGNMRGLENTPAFKKNGGTK